LCRRYNQSRQRCIIILIEKKSGKEYNNDVKHSGLYDAGMRIAMLSLRLFATLVAELEAAQNDLVIKQQQREDG